MRKGDRYGTVNCCPAGHPRTPENTYTYRRNDAPGKFYTQCAVCRSAWRAEKWATDAAFRERQKARKRQPGYRAKAKLWKRRYRARKAKIAYAGKPRRGDVDARME